MQTNLELETILREYSQELENFLRLDDEVSDLIISSPMESFEFILNRDITIFLKPYSLLNINIIKEILKKSEYYFTIFYNSLEVFKSNPKVYIPMIRYFIFLGKDRKLFSIFLEFHKGKNMFPLLLLSTYYTTYDAEEFKNYKDFIEGNYNQRLLQLQNVDHLYYFFLKRNFDIFLKKIYTFNSLKNSIETFYLIKNHFHKILLYNWIFTNLLTIGNFYIAYQFYLWLKKKEEFLFQKELMISWEVKFAFLFIKNQKFYMLKYFKKQEFFFYNQKEFLHTYQGWFPQLVKMEQVKIHTMIKELMLEYDFIKMYILIHYFYEEIMLIGLKFLENHIEFDPSSFWSSIQQVHFKIFNQDFLLGDSIEFLLDTVIYIIYKYRKKLIQFFHIDPFYRGVIGFFYESFKPDISMYAYQSIEHPLIILRFYELYKNNKNSDKNFNPKIRKKVENLKNFFMMANQDYGG